MENIKQLEIISAIPHLVENNEKAIIRARPGTGKTFTLKAIAETYPEYNFLYVSFSRENIKNTAPLLPKNCKSYTIHSLARKFTKNKEVGIVNAYSTSEISTIMKTSSKISRLIKKLLADFFNSPEVSFKKFLLLRKRRGQNLPPVVYSLTSSFIDKMSNREIPLSHSFYLKEFSFNLANGMQLKNIDCLLIDEYQDTSGVIASVYEKFTCTKIYVGDEDQAIFGFMGGMDSSLGQQFNQEFSLDINYRSNSEVIKKANYVLHSLLGRNYSIHQGVEDLDISEIGKNAIICRTNSSIIQYIDVLENFELSKEPDEIFETALIYREWMDGSRNFSKRYWYLRKNRTNSDLLKHIKEVGDKGMMSAYLIAIKYPEEDKLRKLYDKAISRNSKKALHRILSGHASKGLEFDNVRIGFDFPSLFDLAKQVKLNLKPKFELEEEIRLYYVALTRAKHKIIDMSPNANMSKAESFFIRNVLKMH